MDEAFGELVRRRRTVAGWSLRDLAERITYHRGYIGKVEQTEKFPERRFAELLDAVFGSAEFTRVWESERELRHRSEALAKLLNTSVADSLRLIEADDPSTDVAAVQAQAHELTVAYLTRPAATMLKAAVDVRGEILRRLRVHDHRPAQASELYAALGRVQGVLAYAALDLGHPSGAMTHVKAAGAVAERIDSDELRVWVCGTQSLILRYEKRFTEAECEIRRGMAYPVGGTGRLRLLAGLAQCRANLGDETGVHQALELMTRERENLPDDDAADDGLFGFSRAKQHYYAASSLMWLTDPGDLERSAVEAETAVALWRDEPPRTRSLDDEALAHVYAGIAHARLGSLDDAARTVAPVLDLPPERQISWIRNRLTVLADLVDHQFARSTEAAQLSERIRSTTRGSGERVRERG